MYLFYSVCKLNTNNMDATTLEYIDIFLMQCYVHKKIAFPLITSAIYYDL